MLALLISVALAHASSSLPDCAQDDAALGALRDAAAEDETDRALATPTADDTTHKQLNKRLSKRVKTVTKLDRAGKVCTAEAHQLAARVLLASGDATHLQRAHELAHVAATANLVEARWVAAYAFDKWQVALRNPQAYGTQQLEQAGQLCFYPVNNTTTDDERTQWGTPTLTASLTAFLQAVGRTDIAPDLEAIRRRGLLCDISGK